MGRIGWGGKILAGLKAPTVLIIMEDKTRDRFCIVTTLSLSISYFGQNKDKAAPSARKVQQEWLINM